MSTSSLAHALCSTQHASFMEIDSLVPQRPTSPENISHCPFLFVHLFSCLIFFRSHQVHTFGVHPISEKSPKSCDTVPAAGPQIRQDPACCFSNPAAKRHCFRSATLWSTVLRRVRSARRARWSTKRNAWTACCQWSYMDKNWAK